MCLILGLQIVTPWTCVTGGATNAFMQNNIIFKSRNPTPFFFVDGHHYTNPDPTNIRLQPHRVQINGQLQPPKSPN